MLAQSLHASQVSPRAAIRVTILSLVALLLGISLLLAVRRVVGAISFVFPLDAIVIIAIAATLCVTAARIIWRKAFPHESNIRTWEDQFVGWGTSAALALTAISCSFPGERIGDWLIWLPALVADQFLLHSLFVGSRSSLKLAAPEKIRDDGIGLSDQVVQQLYRMRDTQGREVIQGKLRADFEDGQRTAVLHVGFCPPLAYLPRIDAAAQDDATATVKVVQALAHGARVDVRLAEPCTAGRRVWIAITATADAPSE